MEWKQNDACKFIIRSKQKVAASDRARSERDEENEWENGEEKEMEEDAAGRRRLNPRHRQSHDRGRSIAGKELWGADL